MCMKKNKMWSKKKHERESASRTSRRSLEANAAYLSGVCDVQHRRVREVDAALRHAVVCCAGGWKFRMSVIFVFVSLLNLFRTYIRAHSHRPITFFQRSLLHIWLTFLQLCFLPYCHLALAYFYFVVLCVLSVWKIFKFNLRSSTPTVTMYAEPHLFLLLIFSAIIAGGSREYQSTMVFQDQSRDMHLIEI